MLHLWYKIKRHYKLARPPTKLNGLTEDMIKLSGRPPRFRAEAAKTRHLVAFALELAEKLHKKLECPWHPDILCMVRHLFTFDLCMGRTPYD